jgi:hypothetical protein
MLARMRSWFGILSVVALAGAAVGTGCGSSEGAPGGGGGGNLDLASASGGTVGSGGLVGYGGASGGATADGATARDAAVGVDDGPATGEGDTAETQADLAVKVPDAPAGEDSTDLGEDATDDAGAAGTVETGDGVPRACWYQKVREGVAVPYFSFSLVAPDQVSYSCPSSLVRDAGPPWPRELRGTVTRVGENQLTIDTCLPQDSCEPNLYTFTVNAPGIRLAIPLGRPVRVQWQMTVYWGCMEWLAVSDDELDLGGTIWFVGNRGYQKPVFELPFDVDLDQLDCRLPADAFRSSCSGAATGDYAFRFTSKHGPASSLVLGTLEDGSFAFQDGAGLQQTMEIHCLRAFQTVMCDDYWNWEFWAVTTSAPPDGPAYDAGGP